MKSYDALFSNITYLVLLHYLRNRKPRTDSALVHAACNTVQLLQRYAAIDLLFPETCSPQQSLGERIDYKI